MDESMNSIEFFENWKNLTKQDQEQSIEAGALENLRNIQGLKLSKKPELLEMVWENTDTELREKYKSEFAKIALNYMEIEMQVIVEIASEKESSDDYYFIPWGATKIFEKIYSDFSIEEQTELMQSTLNNKNLDLYSLIYIFKNSNEEIQNQNFDTIVSMLSNTEKLREYLINDLNTKNDNDIIEFCMRNLSEFFIEGMNDSLKTDKFQEIYDIVTNSGISLEYFWGLLPSNVMIQHQELFSEIIDKNDSAHRLISSWENMSAQLQESFASELGKIVEHIKQIDEYSDYSIRDLWKATSENTQRLNIDIFSSIIETMGTSYDKVSMWEVTKENIQTENVDIFYNILKSFVPDIETEDNRTILTSIKTYNLENIWRVSSEEFQRENIEDLIQQYKQSGNEKEDFNKYIASLWNTTKGEVQAEHQDIFFELLEYIIKNNLHYDFGPLWKSTANQEQLWENVFDKIQDNQILLYAFWEGTSSDLQLKYWDKMLEINDGAMTKQMWRGTSAEIQERKWEDVTRTYSTDSALVDLYRLSQPKVQENHNELVSDIFKKISSDPERISETWKSIDPSVQKEKWGEVYEIVKDNPDALVKFWETTYFSLQEDNFNLVFEANNENWDILVKFWESTQITAQEDMWEEFLRLTDNDISKKADMWSNASIITQLRKKDFFVELMEQTKDNPENMLTVWTKTHPDIQEENSYLVNDIVKSIDGMPAKCFSKFWNNTKSELLTPELLDLTIRTMYSDLDEEKIINIIDNYNILKSTSPDISKTINLKILDPSLSKVFTTEQLIRLTADSNIQSQIVEYIDNPQILKIINYVVENSENWTIELSDLCNKFKSYDELLSNLPEEELTDESLPQLISCLSGSKNYFNIKNMNDVENFFEKRKSLCKLILEGEDVSEYMSEDFNNLDSSQKKLFAMLELAYGIDINEAQNLVYKYGQDIEEIETTSPSEETLKKTLTALKLLVNSNMGEIDYIYQENKDIILNWDELQYSNIATLEANSLNLYARLFDESCRWSETALESADFNGKNVPIAEITSDFKTFVRVEGAYSYWEEPDNFADYLNNINPDNNGNCKSYIGNNLFAMARPKGPAFGYNRCPQNSLNLFAPWDIISDSANCSFSPGSVKWDFENGIQFRSPDKLLDFVRHNHNEAVTNRWYFDEQSKTVKKEIPDFVLYTQSSLDQDITQDPRWEMSVKAAAQLGIPIKIVNIEKVLQRESEKVDKLKQIFLGQIENDTNLSQEEILKRLIVEFENNRVSTRFTVDKVKSKYFTDDMREDLYSSIESRIESFKDADPEQYFALLQSMKTILTGEYEKAFSVNGTQVHGGADFDFIVDKMNHYNDKVAENTNSVELSNGEMQELISYIQAIDNTSYYDNNKLHSIEHIGKVVLFSKILAKTSGLDEKTTKLLLAAAAFHDSGRDGNDENHEHAEASAIQIKKYLEQNPDNPFGITKENIGILQTAIHYHEHYESHRGQLDTDKIKELAKQYNVLPIYMQETKQICELLKDADALDRFRFAKRGSLDTSFLKTLAAKNPEIMAYARNVNRNMAKQILQQIYGINENEIVQGEEILQLRNIRKKKEIESQGKYVEPHLSMDELMKSFGLEAKELEISEESREDNSKNEKLKNLYRKYNINLTNIKTISEIFRSRDVDSKEQ